MGVLHLDLVLGPLELPERLRSRANESQYSAPVLEFLPRLATEAALFKSLDESKSKAPGLRLSDGQ